ncbi:variant leucine-rich repeat-containing protein [Georgenia subflava]|nr:hypothetical protein [Georgenia subflava]
MADDAGELARLAADPRTPLTTLQQLAQEHPELRAAVAANPSTYPALVEWLGRLGMPDVDAALARRAQPAAPAGEPGPAAPEAEPQPERPGDGAPEPGETQETEAVAPPARAAGGAEREVEIDDRPTLVRPAATTPGTPAAGAETTAGEHDDTQEPSAAEEPTAAAEGPTERDVPARSVDETATTPRAEPVPDDGQPFDPYATAVFTDPDLLRADGETAPPTFTPSEPVARPVEAMPTDAPTEVFSPVAPTRPARATAEPAAGAAGGEPAAGAAGEPAAGAAGAGPRVFGFDPPASTPPGGLRRVIATSDPGGRRPMWMLLALVGLLILIALIVFLATRGDDEPVTPPATTGAATTATTTEPTTAATQEATTDVDAARTALVALPDATTCDDAAADSAVVDEFAAAAAPGGTWQDPASGEVVLTALRGVQDACDPAYAVAVEQALLDDPETSTAVVTTLGDATEWVRLARPAPPGAQERTSFTSPSANIACTLGAETDAAACTITDRDFPDPEGCSPGPVTLAVSLGGAAAPNCPAGPVAGNGVLEYGQSATAGYFACTSERDGVTCWSTLTGQGFSVARAAFETF